MRSCLCAPLFSTTLTIHSGKRNMLLDCLQPIHTPEIRVPATSSKLFERMCSVAIPARTRFLTEDSIHEMLFAVSQADPDASVGDCPHRKKADEQDASSLVQEHLSILVLLGSARSEEH